MKFFPEVIYKASDYGKPKGRKSMKNLQKHAEVSSASSQFFIFGHRPNIKIFIKIFLLWDNTSSFIISIYLVIFLWGFI